ncbi:tetratricopeptide repeat protein [Anaerolineales bacterium HSG6]|nr:tetratricopeptide repeat protein [Anaerolineales bacterium HSG6]
MLEINVLDLIPKPIRKKAMDVTVDFVVNTGKNYLGGEIISRIKKLRSDGEFQNGFEAALQRAGERFVREYIDQDEDLATALADDVTFFEDEQVQQALLKILRNPGVYQADEQTLVNQSFDGILPRRRNRERVNRAVNFFLQCLQEEVWNLPELRPIYELQFQRVTAEAVQEQVALQHAQLQATVNMSEDIRGALLQLTEAIAEQKLLPAGEQSSEVLKTSELLPKHNLPQPDYERFIGRKTALKQIRKLLSPEHRSWVVTIDGIGGIGKSALALEVADSYRRHYDNLPEEDRFEAIIWTTAKLSMLTGEGIITRTQNLRTLDDIYTTISVTLERDDITRARTEEQSDLVTNALTQQRTLLIIDNLETVDDERVMAFIRDVPTPTKVMVTTRHRLDIAYPVRLVGMSEEEALELIADEARIKGITLVDEAESAGGSHPIADSHSMTHDQAHQLYHRTGGVPLAIVWSVAQMGFGYGVESVLTRLGQPNNDIAKFCFEGAVERIKGRPSHKLLMALSLFATDASRGALGYVADLPELDRDDGLVELEKLSLVNKMGGRFGLLPLAKVYAKAELLVDGEISDKLQLAYIDYFEELCRKYGGTNWDLYTNLDSDIRNIQLALEQAYHLRMWLKVGNLVDDLVEFLDRRGLWDEIVEYSEMAVRAGLEINNKQSIMKHKSYGLGWLKAMKFKEFDEAIISVKESEKLALELNDERGLAIALRSQGHIYRNLGQYEKGKDYLTRSLSIWRKIGDKRWEIRTLSTIGGIEERCGNLKKAFNYYEECLEEAKKYGDTEQIALNLRKQSYLYWLEGDFEQAHFSIQKALTLWEQVKDLQEIALSYLTLVKINYISGNIEQCYQQADKAYSIYSKLKIQHRINELGELLNTIKVSPNDPSAYLAKQGVRGYENATDSD